jgi:hypothetical protein
MTLRDKVFAVLDTATQNGYDMMEDPSFIAADMLVCDADFEHLTDAEQVEVLEHVVAWQKTQEGKGS